MPPVVGGEDSTVVGISERSPAGGERLGGCLQSERVSEEQGTCYCMHPPFIYTPHVDTKTNSDTAHTDTHYCCFYTACAATEAAPDTHSQ